MSGELVIPEPGALGVLAPPGFAVRVREHVAGLDGLPEVDEMRRQLAALEAYVTDKGQKGEAQAGSRWAEVRIGQLLGPAPEFGSVNQHSEGALPRDVKLDHHERYDFRRLAEHVTVVQAWVDAGKSSRSAVLKEITRREWAAKRDAAVAAVTEKMTAAVSRRAKDAAAKTGDNPAADLTGAVVILRRIDRGMNDLLGHLTARSGGPADPAVRSIVCDYSARWRLTCDALDQLVDTGSIDQQFADLLDRGDDAGGAA